MLLRSQLNIIVAGMPEIEQGRLALNRVQALIAHAQPADYGGDRAIVFTGAAQLDAVSFGYGDQPLLRDVSLTLTPGECVAICGANGTGKTTMVSLLLGLLKPRGGRALADGVAYDGLALGRLRTPIGLVPQEALLFTGSVADNIAYGLPQAAATDLVAASRLAGAHDFITALSLGYQTPIGEDGPFVRRSAAEDRPRPRPAAPTASADP